MNTNHLKTLFESRPLSERRPVLSEILMAIFILILASLASTANAHHSWGAVYNGGEPVKVTAVITSKAYRNPHDRVEVTIVNEAEETEEWRIEWRGRRGGNGGGRGQAVQYDLNPGDEVIVEGRTALNPGLMAIQMTKLTRVSDGMTIEASLDRPGGAEGRGGGRNRGHGGERRQRDE